MLDFNATEVQTGHIVLKGHSYVIIFSDFIVVFQPSHRDWQGALQSGLEGSGTSSKGAGALDFLYKSWGF